jgi:antitoxin MazE
MQIFKWGNSLAVRLPSAIVEMLNLKAGDDIAIRIEGQRELVVEDQPTRADLIAKIRQMGRPLPPGFKFNREEANARQADDRRT